MDGAIRPTPLGAPVLVRLRAALDALHGDRLERAVLFGSRARGDARAEADYDVAVFLRAFSDLWRELQPLGAVAADILLDTAAVVSAKPFPNGMFHARTALMEAIRREGIEL